MQPRHLLLITAILLAPLACASNQEIYINEAQAFCEIHNPEQWKDRVNYSAQENFDYLSERIRSVVKSEGFLQIFDKLSQQGYADFYRAIQPQISRLVGEEWQCEHAKSFYALQWVRQGETSGSEKVTIIAITGKGTVEINGKIFPTSEDAVYKAELAAVAKTKDSKILLKVPAGTDSKRLEQFLKPMRELKIKKLSVLYY
jgi:hypothetical protein